VWLGRLGKAFAVFLVAVIGLWIAIHRVVWLGPWLAEAGRSVFGTRFVAWVEDVAYGVQDRVDRWRYKDRPPRTFWSVPSGAAAARRAPSPSPSGQPTDGGAPADQGFLPKAYEPPFPEVASDSDGIWVPVPDPREPERAVAMYKSMVHPDPRRGFGVLAVIAVDLKTYELELAAGTTEPSSNSVFRSERPGLIPAQYVPRLVAAFNGGFRAAHGQYGMMLNGKEFLPPRDIACTLARYSDGSLRIGTWSTLKADVGSMTFYRQTPPCLVEDGDTHKALHYQEYAKGWGATVDGETVIRRSAIGLDAERQVLFYGVGDAMTAQAIARGMKAVGAYVAAELDVNYSYPRFLLYGQKSSSEPPRATEALIPGIKFEPDEYVTRPCERDFFFLLRSEAHAEPAPTPVAPPPATASRPVL